MRIVSREEAAWLAGLFEGEGWICVQNRNAALGAQMSDLQVLENFQKLLGCGNIHQRKLHAPNRKPQWTWRVCNFQEVQATIAYMWNGLGTRRKARAKEVLKFAKLSIGRSIRGKPRGKYRKKADGFSS